MSLSPPTLHAVTRVAAAYRDRPGVCWAGSPFEWLSTLSSRTKGAAGEALLEEWLSDCGATVERAGTSSSDRLVNGVRVEVKTSTLWANGQFTFQQLRDQDYDTVALLGIAPFEAYLWWVPKATLWACAEPQHTGRGGADTRWLSFRPTEPPAALLGFGGPLEATLARLARRFNPGAAPLG